MKILVIEDEQKVAAFIKSGLEQNQYEVDLAYDGFIGEKLLDAGEEPGEQPIVDPGRYPVR